MPRHRHNVVSQAARVLCAAGAFIVVLVACDRRSEATPPAELPVLERPVIALKTAPPPAPVRVPVGAVANRAGLPGVFVLDDATAFPPPARDAAGNPLPRARFRMIERGRAEQKQVEILSGLMGGEVLVLGDLEGVRDGSPIAVKR